MGVSSSNVSPAELLYLEFLEFSCTFWKEVQSYALHDDSLQIQCHMAVKWITSSVTGSVIWERNVMIGKIVDLPNWGH